MLDTGAENGKIRKSFISSPEIHMSRPLQEKTKSLFKAKAKVKRLVKGPVEWSSGDSERGHCHSVPGAHEWPNLSV